jgi:hypothetical protein
MTIWSKCHPVGSDAYAVSRQAGAVTNTRCLPWLARCGLPAGMAIGLVHMNDGFYYHAWVQYWAGRGGYRRPP